METKYSHEIYYPIIFRHFRKKNEHGRTTNKQKIARKILRLSLHTGKPIVT